MATIVKLEQARGTRFKAIVRRQGSGHLTKVCRTRSEALRWATKTEAVILDGKLVPQQRELKRTVSDLIAEYREHVLPKLKPHSRKPRVAHLRWWDRVLGTVRLSDVRRRDIVECMRRLEKTKTHTGTLMAPATRNRYLGTLRHAWGIALKEWEWVSENPLSGMQLKEPRGRVRFLSEQERDALLAACKASRERRLYPLVVLALATGARQQELLSLRFRDIDLERRVAILDATKNDERRAVPLSAPAVAVLSELKGDQDENRLIFANRRGRAPYPRYAFLQACEVAGLEDFRFHDLRHTAASYLAMSGASLVELATILGHKTLAMVKRYAHLTDQHSAAVVDRMSERFLSDAGGSLTLDETAESGRM